MKKLIILFSFFFTLKCFSQSVTFPSESSNIFGTLSMTDWVQIDTFPIAQNDSIRYIRINGINYVNKNYKSTTWDAMSLRLFADGSDQTARLNYLLTTKTFIKKYRFTQQSTGNIKIDGTVIIPAGVIFEFDGIGINGSGTITGQSSGTLVIAPQDAQIFTTTLTVTGIKTMFGFFPARWFGSTADGSTDNYTIFLKAQAATFSKFQPVFVQSGDHRINSVFNQTVSFIGETGSKIKFDRTSTTTGRIMWTVNDDSLLVKDIHIDGSNKVQEGIRVAVGMTDVEINHVEIDSIYQVGSDVNTVEGIYFTFGCDRLKIINCYIHDIDAPNTGIARGVRGAGTGAGPKDVLIGYNTFDDIFSTYVSSTDADQICIQDYTDSLKMRIIYNTFNDIGKRAAKLSASGIEFAYNEGYSTLYTASKRSYSFFSIYGNAVNAHHNKCWQGVFENAIDVGSTGTWDNVTVEDNKLYLTVTSLGNNDGIRIFGSNNHFLNINRNYVENVRNGIYLDCSDSLATVNDNTVVNSTSNAYTTNVASNSYPNTWHRALTMDGNKAKQSSASYAFDLWKIDGLSFNGNKCWGVSHLILYGSHTDSIIGRIKMEGNVNFSGGSSPNDFASANKPTATNSNALIGLVALYRDTLTYVMHKGGGVWVAVGTASSGITSLSGDVSATGPGAASATIQSDVVSNTKLANMAAKTYKGRNTNSTGDPEDVSVANVRTDLSLADAIYTPTIADKTNISTTSIDSVGYSRNGSSVEVFGYASITTTNVSSSACSFSITLPVTTSFPQASPKYANGPCYVLIGVTNYTGWVSAITGNKVLIQWTSTGATLGGCWFHFSYRVM
ncbi:MAG: hypothetical protein QM802_19855 [Agriterribacter sp.]